ncbi:MAG: portal protein [Desulfovibrionaceae bacterium]
MIQNIKDITDLVTYVENTRKNWEPLWRNIKQYVLPHRALALDNEDNTLSSEKIIDATATRAVRITASGLLSGLTSPARPWFRLKFTNHEDNESSEAREWLDLVEERVRSILLQTGFYQAAHSMFTDLITYGSANIYIEDHPERIIQFSCLGCGEFSWAGDESGNVDTVVRRYHVPVRFAAERFGVEKLHRTSQELLLHNPYSPIELVHVVCPATSPAMKKPYQSITYEALHASGEALHMGGYYEFPHIIARWDTSASSVYGYSPAMDTLPDIKMLQEMAKSQISAIHKVVNPPMKVPADLKSRLNLIPGAPNYVNPSQKESISPLYQIKPDVHALSQKIEDVRRAIKEGFFNDLFLLFAEQTATMTAQEVLERSDEKLLLLGPIIERHQTEVLNPLLQRTIGILSRNGMLPPQPQSNTTLTIEYISTLAQAQKIQTSSSIRQLVKDVALLTSLDHNVIYKIDCLQIVDELAIHNSLPARIIRSDAEVEERIQHAKDNTTEDTIDTLYSTFDDTAKDSDTNNASSLKKILSLLQNTLLLKKNKKEEDSPE